MADALEAKRRWYRLTPDRLVVGLLAAEGLLLLSERFRWFAFNQHKGWTVLIDVATVGLTLLVMLLWFAAALLFRWRFQYSLRSLMLLTVAVAVACSWFATRMQRAGEQRAVMEAVTKSGGELWYCDDPNDPFNGGDVPPDPQWLRDLVGNDFLGNAIRVRLHSEHEIDALTELPQLESLALSGKGITDAALEHVERLTHLKELQLSDSRVTDSGLWRLKELTQLKSLWLDGTKITDAGLAHLAALPELRALVLWNTDITDAGLEHLKEFPQLETLNLCNTRITDAGLAHLKGLTHIRWLDLSGTKVTDEGVKKLEQALPDCKICHEARRLKDDPFQ